MKNLIVVLLLIVVVTFSCSPSNNDCDCVVVDSAGAVIAQSQFETDCSNDGERYYGYQGIIQGTVKCN